MFAKPTRKEITGNQDNNVSEKSPQEKARKKEIEEQIIVDYIIKNGRIQRSEVMELLGCGETKAKRVLRRMASQLEKNLKGKYMYYILKTNVDK